MTLVYGLLLTCHEREEPPKMIEVSDDESSPIQVSPGQKFQLVRATKDLVLIKPGENSSEGVSIYVKPLNNIWSNTFVSYDKNKINWVQPSEYYPLEFVLGIIVSYFFWEKWYYLNQVLFRDSKTEKKDLNFILTVLLGNAVFVLPAFWLECIITDYAADAMLLYFILPPMVVVFYHLF